MRRFANNKPALGIDVGGTKTELGLVDQTGEVVWRDRRPTPQLADPDPYQAFLDLLVDMVETGVRQGGLGPGQPIGMCLPGAIDQDGRVKNSNALWMNEQPLKADLERRLGRNAVMANDGVCFAVSEAMDGAAKEASMVFGVVLGTGVGGGLAVDGRPWHGTHGLCGEWGHNPFPVRSRADFERLEAELGPVPTCFCGQSLCVETVLRGRALAARYERLSGRSVEGAEFARLIEQKDADAQTALHRYGLDLARALSVVVNQIDPDVIVLGGGVSDNDELVSIVSEALPDYIFHAGQVDTRPQPVVRRHVWGGSSGLRGAAWMAQSQSLGSDAPIAST